jgi:hypothetical protein
MKREIDTYSIILIAIVFLCIILIFFQNLNFTGRVVEFTTSSDVSIQEYLSISISQELANGIIFGTIVSLPSDDVNATGNYDINNETEYYINISEDSNTNVDLCIKALTALENLGGDVIGITNQTYSNSTINDVSNPEPSSKVALSLSYIRSGENLTIGSENYYRFWLDVPASTPPGSYENSIRFKGTSTGIGCGS